MAKTKFTPFLWKCIASQMVTYMVFGLIFSVGFKYHDLFQSEGLGAYMRPTNHPLVALGPAYQLIRGALFALVFYPIWSFISSKRTGWLILWWLLLGLSIFGVCGPAPGSLEGLLFTILPIKTHLLGLPEIILQTLAFSLLLFYWDRHPKRYFSIMMSTLTILILLMGVMGYIALSQGLNV